jgi:hypothetical protein
MRKHPASDAFRVPGNQMWGKAGQFAWQSGRPFEITGLGARETRLSKFKRPEESQMAHASRPLASDPAASEKTESPTVSERSRRAERRVPSARETMATLPELEADALDFEPHDTIPAPPWLDELDEQIAPPHKSS